MQDLLSILNSLRAEELIAVSIIPVLFAITVHEVAHGWIAKRLGDPTAQRLGRLTLNPLKHIDPIGTVVLPAVLILLRAGFLFGWARPVPVTWENLRHPKRDMVLVAVAGPVANLLMALVWGLIAKIGISLNDLSPWVGTPMMLMGLVGIYINVLLLVFNLLPVPPLDGGRVAVGLLPGPLSWRLSRLEPYGFFILIGLLLAPRIIGVDILGAVIFPIISTVMALVVFFVGLS